MSQDQLKKLRELEEQAAQLKDARARASERLRLLRIERDKHIKALEAGGVDPRTAQEQIDAMSDDITKDIESIENQIPPNLEELLANVATAEDSNTEV